MNNGVFRGKKYKWRFAIIAFLFALMIILAANMLVGFFTRQFDFTFDWATLGLGVLLAYFVRDLLFFYQDDKDERIIFTNYRDSLVIVFGSLVASSTGCFLQAILPDNLFITFVAYSLAILLALIIFFLGGSHKLKRNVLPTKFQKSRHF